MEPLVRGLPMAADFEGREVLEAVVAGIPAMADYVAALPEGQRTTALDALERHYLQTVQNLGGAAEPARMWVSAVMLHLRKQIETATKQPLTDFAGYLPDKDYSLAEKILTRATGAVALLAVSPLIAFVWVGLKFERFGPAIDTRTTGRSNLKDYRFVLGSGWISRFVLRANLRDAPQLWHLVNGDTVLSFKDFAEVVRPG
jgi:hypothetical protein